MLEIGLKRIQTNILYREKIPNDRKTVDGRERCYRFYKKDNKKIEEISRMKQLVLITEVQGHRFEVKVNEINMNLGQMKQFIELMGCKFQLKLV